MYSSFFRLTDNPFGETPHLSYFVASPTHALALSQILAFVHDGHGFATLIGEVGTGKTLLSRVLWQVVKPHVHASLVLHPVQDAREILDTILLDMDERPPATLDMQSRIHKIQQVLLSRASQGKRNLLIIDEAQRLSNEALENIRLLSNLETNEQKLLQILIVGQTELTEKLNSYPLRQLNQRISVRAELRPLRAEEVSDYIAQRIAKAGGENFIRFEPEVHHAIYKKSQGVPRLINFYCEQILRMAETQNVRRVGTDLVARLWPELFPPTLKKRISRLWSSP